MLYQLKNRAGINLHGCMLINDHILRCISHYKQQGNTFPAGRMETVSDLRAPTTFFHNKTATQIRLALSCQGKGCALPKLRNQSMVYRKTAWRHALHGPFSAGHVIVTIFRSVCQVFFLIH